MWYIFTFAIVWYNLVKALFYLVTICRSYTPWRQKKKHNLICKSCFHDIGVIILIRTIPSIITILNIYLVCKTTVCSRFYLQKNEYTLRTSKGDKWLLVKIYSWNQDSKFSLTPHLSLMKHDFLFIKIQTTSSNHSLQIKCFPLHHIPRTKSFISSTSSTFCGTLVYKWNDAPNDFYS